MLFMLIGLAGGGALAFLNMRHSIHSTVDEQLRERMRVVSETVDRTLSVGQVEKLRKELAELLYKPSHRAVVPFMPDQPT